MARAFTNVEYDYTETEAVTFPVTIRAVIGHVHVGDGHAPAHVVAFGLIAEHDRPGEYEFPMPNGQTCRVTVEHVDPA